MKNLIKIFWLLILCWGCSNSVFFPEEGKPEINIQPNLSIDENGYYHLEVIRMEKQTLHKLSAITNSKTSSRVEWEANSTWYDSVVIINDRPNRRQKETSWSNGSYEIPVINKVSYTSPTDGMAYTMFAPVVELIGDTVLVTATYENVIDKINIILE